MKIHDIPTPFYIVYEERLRRNLELIRKVSEQSGAKIIMAFKANALWRTFDIVREYCQSFTASSLNELRLGREYLGEDAHSYCPAYTDATIDEYLAGSTHLTFNSISQYRRFADKVRAAGVSPGLRVNPKCSVIETDIYNPALPGSRFGVSASDIGDTVPEGIEGLHFHALCESSSYDLEKVLAAFEEQFGHLLPQVKWVNMGGGHLMTREGYDTEHLIGLLRDFRSRYPHLQVILEPGSAFTWRTGDLITSVVDTICNDGIDTAIVDVSFACHMPDTLEMPYQPHITESIKYIDDKNTSDDGRAGDGPLSQPNADTLPDGRAGDGPLSQPRADTLPDGRAGDGPLSQPRVHPYRLGGNSCLSGDYCGPWYFDHKLQEGERLTLEDMNHYTTVKTTMFNGIQHPAIVLCRADGDCQYLRQYDYDDYKNRMS